MYRTKALLSLAVILSIASASTAFNIVYVDVNGPNDPGSGTFEDPFRRIQTGINAAANGDIVQIQPGVYTGPGNYDLDLNGKSITIRSSDPNDADVVDNTIIDPNFAGRGFYIHSGEDTICTISGLTIRNAYVAIGNNGAGIYCYNCSPIISNCVIRDCFAEGGSGGGICLSYGSATIINCTITGNTAGHYGYGGGISCQFSSPTIIGCTIKGNTATITGGGIDSGKSEPNIFNCIIVNNNAAAGGGINCYYPGTSRVVNCTIAGNWADYLGGAVFCWSGGGAIIENSLLWANSASEGTQLGIEGEGTVSIAYCDVQDGNLYDPCERLNWDGGNMDSDPCFASFDPNGDPNMWDLHLQSAYGRWDQNSQTWLTDSNTSLCIDAGDPNSEWSSEPWPNGKRINMGAYGGTSQASKNGNPADFNIDNSVNFVDFAQMANQWLVEQMCIEDLTNDGKVNFADIFIFAENWLWEKQ